MARFPDSLCLRLFTIGCSIATFTMISSGAARANLLLNGSFEDIPAVPVFGQGVLPLNWEQIGISADTYSTDSSYGLNLPDNPFGHFQDITAAQDGVRFVAGADFSGGIQEGFGQQLSNLLTAGETYTFSAYLHQDTPGNDTPAGYEILLSDTPDYNSPNAISLGITAATTGVPAWEFRELNFVAPVNAGSLSWFILRQRSFVPTDTTYPAIDNLELNLGTVTVPEPGTVALLTLGLGIAGVAVARRRGSA